MPRASIVRSSVGRTACTVAGAAAIALFAGCGSSSDSGGSAGSGSSGGGSGQSSNDGGLSASATGPEIFEAMSCKSCHTLAAENATGVIGPNLDKEKPPVAEIVEKVTNGDGSMPSFKKRLTAEQIQTLADYVAKVEGT